MRWKVELYVAGSTFYEEMYATNRSKAIQTATARNPTARVISANPIFK